MQNYINEAQTYLKSILQEISSGGGIRNFKEASYGVRVDLASKLLNKISGELNLKEQREEKDRLSLKLAEKNRATYEKILSEDYEAIKKDIGNQIEKNRKIIDELIKAAIKPELNSDSMYQHYLQDREEIKKLPHDHEKVSLLMENTALIWQLFLYSDECCEEYDCEAGDNSSFEKSMYCGKRFEE